MFHANTTFIVANLNPNRGGHCRVIKWLWCLGKQDGNWETWQRDRGQKGQVGHYIDLVWNKQVNDIATAQKIFEKFLAEGQEGTILKSKDGIWEDKRSKTQIKFKGELECELKVVDWEEGTGKNIGRLGALVCESSDGVIRVNVGSGYSDEQRDEYTKKVIGKIVTVKYNARIKDKSGVESLFLPVFIELREDKDKAESSKSIK